MKAQNLKTTVVPTLLATLFTVPAAAGIETGAPAAPTDGATARQIAEAIKRETVQFFSLDNEPGKVQLMIAGQPGVHFRLYYSKSGADGQYRRLEGAAGTIDANGFANQIVDLGRLGGGTLHLKIFTSDQANFSGEVRMTASAIEAVGGGGEGVRLRGWTGRVKRALQRRRRTIRTPTAVAAVRGKLPEEVRTRPTDTN